MELSELRKLVRLMESAELSELEIDDSKRGLRVHLKRSTSEGGEAGLVPQVVQVVPSAGAAAPVVAAPQGASLAAPSAPAAPADAWPAGTEAFPSPMVGTFYRSASPEAEPFVDVGAKVTEDSVLCIIEAMKVMNEIRAERRGEVVEVLVENGEPVEFGQPLFLLRKG
jgi:acetyl-CoA carboxylase biotin carboxyl carrier protein